ERQNQPQNDAALAHQQSRREQVSVHLSEIAPFESFFRDSACGLLGYRRMNRSAAAFAAGSRPTLRRARIFPYSASWVRVPPRRKYASNEPSAAEALPSVESCNSARERSAIVASLREGYPATRRSYQRAAS